MMESFASQSSLLIWIFVFWLLVSYSLWSIYRKKYENKNSFDVVLLGTIIGLLIHRFVYVLVYWGNYSSNYWSWNPVIWVEGKRTFLGSKPWIFLNFWSSDIDIRILLLCFVIILYVFSKIQHVPFLEILNDILKSLFLSSPVLILASYLHNIFVGVEMESFWGIKYFSFEDKRHPIQLYLILIWILLMITKGYIMKRIQRIERVDGLIMFCLYLLLSSIILNKFSYNISSFMINWILIIAGVSFFFILFGLVTKRVDEQVDDGKQKSDARKFTQFSTNYISENKRKWMKKK